MKILQVNCVYKNGSTGKIVADHHTELLKRGYQSVVAYANGASVAENYVYKISKPIEQKAEALYSRVTGLMYGGGARQTRRLICVIKKEQPDIVHLHCLNGYTANIYKLITWLKNNQIKTVITQHAEFLYTANCGYAYDCQKWKTGCGNCPQLKKEVLSWFFDRTHTSWLKMKTAFNGFDNLMVTSVSPWLLERAKQSPILADKKHAVVYNGLDVDVFKVFDKEELRKKHGLTHQKIVFYATSDFSLDPSHRKGGYYVFKLAEYFKDKNVCFFVAGNKDGKVDAPENVILLGRISDKETLAKYYSLADVTLLTSKRETFSMVCAESLCCGTPIVGFKAGAPEQISLSEYSRFVDYGNFEDLVSVLETAFADESWKEKERISQKAKETYSKAEMTARYCKIYETLIEK
ncbi:MAG: glycosyltransferase [Clostridia bacterium]|nr:glycosyltransferase [Clostridia bacterium]